MLISVGVLAACGSSRPAPVGAESALFQHTWIVEEHVLVKGTSITEADATGFHGRTLEIGDRSFMSPWHGTCERVSRERDERQLLEVVDELEVEVPQRPKIGQFGFGAIVVEYRLSCKERQTPPLKLYISNEKSMTCFGGACYLMKRFIDP